MECFWERVSYESKKLRNVCINMKRCWYVKIVPECCSGTRNSHCVLVTERLTFLQYYKSINYVANFIIFIHASSQQRRK